MPTILDYCGVQTPPVMQGRSFRPLLEQGCYEARRSAYMEYRRPFGPSHKTVRTHEYWYSTNNAGGEMLFDLRGDPNQLRDVSKHTDHSDALHEMRRELLRRWFDVEKQYPLRTAEY